MRRNGIAVALLPNNTRHFELVKVVNLQHDRITVNVNDSTLTFRFSMEDQGKWCTSGILDFRTAEPIMST